MTYFSKRRGRPRTVKLVIDLGTAELQHKRRTILKNHSQIHLSESALGILLVRGLISQKLYDAGELYYELGYQFEPQLKTGCHMRKSSIANLEELRTQHIPIPENDNDCGYEARIARRWKEATTALKMSGIHPMVIVTYVLFQAYDPKSDGGKSLKSLSAHHLLDLRHGLEALAMYFKVT